MAKDNNRSVFKREDGQWVNKRDSASKPASLHSTQKEAEQAAKGMIQKSGGGELTTHGRDGQIRSKDTIAPGNDPCPPKDKEH